MWKLKKNLPLRILRQINVSFFYLFRICSAGTQTLFDTFVEEVEESIMKKATRKMSWFKKLFWFALPVQFVLMVMLFLAWHSSDHHYYFHGCDGSARFHFLYPQLKYINGPPPI